MTPKPQSEEELTSCFEVDRRYWEAAERFRSGMIWNLGKGKVFYFRPGHETYPVYKQEAALKVVENAVRWLGSQPDK